MRTSQFIIFLSVVIIVYSLTNLYIFLKGYNSIQAFHNFKLAYLLGYLVLALIFFGGKVLEATHSSVLSDTLNVIGGFWLAFMLYGFLFLFLSDIVALLLLIPGFINSTNIIVYRKWAYISTLIISLVLIAGGFINSLIPHVKSYNINITKSAGQVNELRIACVSDIHLGSIIRKRSMRNLSAILLSLKPDMVLLLGDIVDGEIGPVLRGDLLKYFSYPDSREGLYAITGNHEFFGGPAKTLPYIEGKGIRLLKDEVITTVSGIQLIGRLDRDSRMFFGRERKPLGELVSETDPTKPIILLDHQPVNLAESEKYGIDLELSGHTHNGQLWPLNLIMKKTWELPYGYLKKGKTQYIVSSGFGLWGPRVRSGSRSEILLLNIRFGVSQDSSVN
ncbi:MAG: metallophosphoesterase [Bacteroidota bacterium]|nr:metallophosphoesterase [Bacteroidota bacterium]